MLGDFLHILCTHQQISRHISNKTNKNKNNNQNNNMDYIMTGHVDCASDEIGSTRKRTDTSVYSVLFNNLHQEWSNVFAACAANRLMLYKIDDFRNELTGEKNERTTLLQCYEDGDENETYYTCCWCSKKNALIPYIACAGAKGVVRVLNCKKKDFCGALVGHGGEINDLRAHPKMLNIIASASKDLSVRLWNVSNGVCVAIFAGARGHRNDVLSVDFHPELHICPESGRKDVVVIASGGMDNAVKVWSTRGANVSKSIENSEYWEDEIVEFPTAQIRAPEFSTFHAHNHFVDCVRYFGDVIFSKSVENKILAWTPDFSLPDHDGKFKKSFRKLKSFNLVDAENWWVRFSLAKECSVLCCGNTRGVVRLWKFNNDDDADDDSSSSSSDADDDDDASVEEIEEEDGKIEKDKDKLGVKKIDEPAGGDTLDKEKMKTRDTIAKKWKKDAIIVGRKLKESTDLKGLPNGTVVRQAEVSRDGKIVLAGCDGGFIYRWDLEVPLLNLI